MLDAARSEDDKNDEDKDARGNVPGLIVSSEDETGDSCDSDDSRHPRALLNKQLLADDGDNDDDEDDDDDDDIDDDEDDDTDSDLARYCCGHRHYTADNDTDGTNDMEDGKGSAYGSGRETPPSTPVAAGPPAPLRNEELSPFRLSSDFKIVKSPGGSLRTPGGSNTEKHKLKPVKDGPDKGGRVEYFTRRGVRPDKSNISKERRKLNNRRQQKRKSAESNRRESSARSSKKYDDKKRKERSDAKSQVDEEERKSSARSSKKHRDKKRKTLL